MLEARRKKIYEKRTEIVVRRSNMSSDQSTMESIVSAQQRLYTVHEMMQIANIAMLKIWSILISKAYKVLSPYTSQYIKTIHNSNMFASFCSFHVTI